MTATRRLLGQKTYDSSENHKGVRFEFVGVWDTVAAYGLPISELTRGIDKWVWPLSMPDYVLSDQVDKACHALSLDDERDTFHPLLWDEVAEEELLGERKVSAGRIEQVWFAGTHSDVGGGYPDDALSYVSLYWMMGKAKAAGLRLKRRSEREVRQTKNEFGTIHNSRSGLSAYYRYQPRKIAARVEPPDATARIMQDPDRQGHGLLRSVKIHESVVNRIRSGFDRYAPVVLPGTYEVVSSNGATLPSGEIDPIARAKQQELVWNVIWMRRIVYFLTVGASLFLVTMPLTLGQEPCRPAKVRSAFWLRYSRNRQCHAGFPATLDRDVHRPARCVHHWGGRPRLSAGDRRQPAAQEPRCHARPVGLVAEAPRRAGPGRQWACPGPARRRNLPLSDRARLPGVLSAPQVAGGPYGVRRERPQHRRRADRRHPSGWRAPRTAGTGGTIE